MAVMPLQRRKGSKRPHRTPLVIRYCLYGITFLTSFLLWINFNLISSSNHGPFRTMVAAPLAGETSQIRERHDKERIDLERLVEISPERAVVFITPLGNTQTTGHSNRTGYEKGADDPFTLRCSLHHAGHNLERALFQAVFDDSQGIASLDIRKIVTVQEVLQRLLFAEEAPMPPATLVFVIDAFDVVIQQSPKVMVERFLQQPYPILFGSEPTCWDPKSGEVHSKVSTPYCSLPAEQRQIDSDRYLNSGLYASTLGTLYAFLEQTISDKSRLPSTKDGMEPWPGTNDTFNDQAYWSYWYAKHHPLIGLDTSDRIFANIGKVTRSKTNFDRATGLLKQKGSPGTIFHFPGQGAKRFALYSQCKKFYRDLDECASM